MYPDSRPWTCSAYQSVYFPVVPALIFILIAYCLHPKHVVMDVVNWIVDNVIAQGNVPRLYKPEIQTIQTDIYYSTTLPLLVDSQLTTYSSTDDLRSKRRKQGVGLIRECDCGYLVLTD